MGKLERIKKEINNNGMARGWHSEQLAKRAKASGETMAQVFKRQIANTCAYTVPATLETLTMQKAVYRFTDNSTIELAPPNRVTRKEG